VRILLSGYYGFDNLGDDALLEVIVSELRTRWPFVEIDVLTAAPDETRHTLRVDATPRGDVVAVRRAIERADVVLSGGGGLLQNATSLRSLMYYAGIVRTAIRAGKKTMIFAQSIGPLDFVGRQIVRECCRGLAAATVRDERSRVLLASLVPSVTVRRTADPVFLYDPPEPEPSLLDAQGLGAASDPLVLVCVRKAPNFADGASRIAEAVDRLAEAHGVRVGFIAFGGPVDAEASTTVMRKCRSSPTLLPTDGLDSVAQIIGRARLLIGMRLHALILAVRLGVPFLAIPYDPKVTGFCEDVGYPLPPLWTPGARTQAARSPADLADEAWRRRDELSALARDASERMRALAAENFSELQRLIA
jgi:polysaccharide pyruvyl transferase CsaB